MVQFVKNAIKLSVHAIDCRFDCWQLRFQNRDAMLMVWERLRLANENINLILDLGFSLFAC